MDIDLASTKVDLNIVDAVGLPNVHVASAAATPLLRSLSGLMSHRKDFLEEPIEERAARNQTPQDLSMKHGRSV